MNKFNIERRQLTFGTWNVPFNYTVDDSQTVEVAQITFSDCYNFWEPIPLALKPTVLVKPFTLTKNNKNFKWQ